MNEDLVSTITDARFTPVVRQGYVMGDVDRFLDRLVAQLSAGEPVREMIEATRFPVASWTETYAQREVDLLLAMVKHKALTRDPDSVDAETPAPEVDPPAPIAMPHVPQPRAEGIVEKKGLLSRFFSSQ